MKRLPAAAVMVCTIFLSSLVLIPLANALPQAKVLKCTYTASIPVTSAKSLTSEAKE